MPAVTDDLPVDIVKTQGRPDDPGRPVMKGRHPVVHMRDAPDAVGKGFRGLFIGRPGMSQGNCDPQLRHPSRQGISRIVLAGHRDDPDPVSGGFPEPVKLRRIRRRTELCRLGPPPWPVDPGALQVDAQDPGAFILCARRRRHVCQRRRQDLLGLCDRRRKKSGDALLHEFSRPVPQSLLLRIIRIESVPAVGVHIDQPRDDSEFSVIHIRLFFSIGINTPDPAAGYLDLRLHPVVQHPDPSALKDHPSVLLPCMPEELQRNDLYSSYCCSSFCYSS